MAKRKPRKKQKAVKVTVRPLPNGSDRSIRIRKIENGIIVSVSGYGKNGRYIEKEHFAKSENEVKKIVGKLL